MFLIGVASDALHTFPRLRVEDHLLEEARSLLRRLEPEAEFDWKAHGFELNEDFHVWEKTLSADDVARVMG